MPAPIYTAANCRFSHPLAWAVTVFWQEPATGLTLPIDHLNTVLEPDGVRILRHRLLTPVISLFLVTTLPAASPCHIVQRLKGRLQHLLRAERPKAFRRHFAIRSIGRARRAVVERYIAAQLAHHPIADDRVLRRFADCQFTDPSVDLDARRWTAHGVFWHVLHLVFVHRDRWREIRAARVEAVNAMIRKAAAAKGYQLKSAGVLPDHVHLLLGCGFDDAPEVVALSFLNNLAFAQGMEPAYQFGGFMGTVGEYDFGAIDDGES